VIARNPCAEMDQSPDEIQRNSETLAEAVAGNIKLATLMVIDLQQVSQELKARTAIVLENGEWVPLMEFVEVEVAVIAAVIPKCVTYSANGPDRQRFPIVATLDLSRSQTGKLCYIVRVVKD